MAEEEDVREFPDVSQKLAAPKKLSAFEKERQAAEAKRQRAEAENAAALKAFEDSFAEEDDGDDGFDRANAYRDPPQGPRGSGLGFGQYGEKHGFAGASASRNGYQSLESFAEGPPAPPSLKRKRALDEMREQQEARREQALYDEGDESSKETLQNQQEEEEEREGIAPMPTVQLASMPLNTTVEDVKILLRDLVKVHSVRFLPPSGPLQSGKRSVSAIVKLSSEMSLSQVDNAVSALKNKYLGCGFYLSISRHLSSAALHPSMTSNRGTSDSQPFGAEQPRESPNQFSMRAAPPPSGHRGFAPPEYYDAPHRSSRGSYESSELSISVRPPMDIETAKAIHIIVDQLLLEPDPERALEMEAMLMALPEVQSDERFAFLYDSCSPAGVYYRFCLWAPEYMDDDLREQKRRLCGPERLFQDTDIDWLPPYAEVTFPDLKNLAQVVTDMDYISSDEESDDEDAERKFNSGREGAGGLSETNEKSHLSPLQRARLISLLSRLPRSNTKLRKGDLARVTNFAIIHAGQGAEEIVDLLLLNILKPFSSSLASHYEEDESEQDEEDIYEPDEALSTLEPSVSQTQVQQSDGKRDDDPSNAKLVALYAISDLLSASSTAGARNAWKYRQIFEAGFKSQQIFEHLGRLDKELAWGRLKSEQWKRKISVVFDIWEGWSVFSPEVHIELKQSFLEPPLSAVEKAEAEAEMQRAELKKQEEKRMSKFKRVGQSSSPARTASPAPKSALQAAKDATAVSSTDDAEADSKVNLNSQRGEELGVPSNGSTGALPHDSANNGAMINDTNAMSSDTKVGGSDRGANDKPATITMSVLKNSSGGLGTKSAGQRRMRAEDMFADSDEE